MKILLPLLFVISFVVAQEQKDSVYIKVAKTKSRFGFKTTEHTFNYNIFSQLYPIRDNPSVGLISSYTKNEKIIFNVYPVLSLSIYNNFRQKLRAGKLFSQGYSFLFRPQFRMYNEQSNPVKMPSYKVLVGLQHLYRISQKHLVSYSIESGHYSNGQSGSTLNGGGKDGSALSDSLWKTITPQTNLSEVINRTSGDFSTNLSELMLNYRFIPQLDAHSKPKQIHSFTTGFVIYHARMFGFINAGGYTDNTIKIYGKWRILLSYAYTYSWRAGYRIMVSENIEVIAGAHPSVNPLRSVLQTTFFFPQSLGVFVSYVYGHDDYNLRLVDSGHQFGGGLTWDIFPPLEIGKGIE